MTHFLDLHTILAADLRGILDQSRAMKDARKGLPKGTKDADQPLKDHIVALIFEKPSTRTRVSFDVGVRQLGGKTLVLSSSDMQLGHGESISDTAQVLSRYVDAIMIRTNGKEVLHELARHATVPVINGLTDESHPCQIMADVMTFEEHQGPIAGKKVVWTGDGNNVAASFLHAAGQFGFNLTFTGPEELDPDPAAVAFARSKGVSVEIERDAEKAVEGADLIVADTWLSMHQKGDSAEGATRHNLLKPFQVNEQLMGLAKPDTLFMHCLPAYREEEATAGVLDGPQSVIFDEAENRLHAQKGILRYCLGV